MKKVFFIYSVVETHYNKNSQCYKYTVLNSEYMQFRILKCLFCTDFIVTDKKVGFYNRLNSYTIKLCSHGLYIWQIFVTVGYLPCLSHWLSGNVKSVKGVAIASLLINSRPVLCIPVTHLYLISRQVTCV